MKKMLIFLAASLALFSFTRCTEDYDPKTKEYFIEFAISGSDGGAHTVKVIQTKPADVDRHDLLNSEFVSVSFSLAFSFANPEQIEILQALYFVIAMEIPKSEFELVSGKYVFKEPANLAKYIPSGNLFEAGNFALSTYYHEDMMTFCTAPPDSAFQNSFVIEDKKIVFDERGNRIMELKGSLEIKYESFCGEEDIELKEGNFIVRLKVDM